MKDPRTGYIPTLDGWRAIAILSVMAAHETAHLVAPWPGWDGCPADYIIRFGVRGVDLFFAISGFLICSRLLEEKAELGRISLRNFYIRRACRILPPAFVYLAGVGLLSALGMLPITGRELTSCLLFFRNYLPFAYSGLTGACRGWYTLHFWSLAVEEHFYLIWPGLLVMAGIRRARWFAGALALIVAAWRWWGFHHLSCAHDNLSSVAFDFRTENRLDALLLGALVALIMSVPTYRAVLRRAIKPVTTAALIVVVVLLIRYNPHLALFWRSLMLPLIIAGTVMYPTSFLGRLLEMLWARWVGRISYSLYLWQQLFLVSAQTVHPFPLGILQEFPVNIAASCALAAASYYVVERPLIRIGHKLAPPVKSGRTDLKTSKDRRRLAGDLRLQHCAATSDTGENFYG